MTGLNVAFSRPNMGREEEEAVLECMRSGWLTGGPRSDAFERAFAAMVGAPTALSTSSGTAALHLALWSLDLAPGDEVLTPSLTWVSAPNIIRRLGLVPVFCEVDPVTLCIDPDDAAKRITPRTRAMVPVHFAGRVADMSRLHDLAATHRLVVVEDAAHAIGAVLAGKTVGSHSSLVAFSFHPNKNITVGEGGLLTGNDAALLQKARLRRYHGFTRDSWDRHNGGTAGLSYDCVEPGLKYVMSDMAAAIGLVQLKRLGEANARRRQLALRYLDLLQDLRNRITLPADSGIAEEHVWHLFAIRMADRPGLRDRVAQLLKAAGVGVGYHYRPVHEMAWVEAEGLRKTLPVTEEIGRTILSLPLHPGLTEAEQDHVVAALKAAVDQAEAGGSQP